MRLNSAKWTPLFLLPLCWTSVSPALNHRFKANSESRLGIHLNHTRDLATHRHQLTAQDNLYWKDWPAISIQSGFKVGVEGAYAANSRYSGPVVKEESSEITIRDLYLQVESGAWIARFGNQQVVWGEAFGFFFADIVNPKDLRTLNATDLSAQRVAVPMANIKWLTKTSSIQAIVIPKPYFHRTPNLGSDLEGALPKLLPAISFELDDPSSASLNIKHTEFGFRATQLFTPVDFSLFYFNYLDRMPNYEASLVALTPPKLRLLANHRRIQTFGATATVDFGNVILRTELLYTPMRSHNIFIGGNLGTITSDEITFVGGVDYTQIEDWHLGIQLSTTHLFRDVANALLSQDQLLFSVLAERTLFGNHSIHSVIGYSPQDGSTIAQIQYLVPVAENVEFGGNIDWLRGDSLSTFGRFSNWTRAFLLMKLYFSST